MKHSYHNQDLPLIITAYFIVFFAVWAFAQWAINPILEAAIGNSAVSDLIFYGILKNLIWTLPAFLLIGKYEADLYIGRKALFCNRVKPLETALMFVALTAYILLNRLLAVGQIAVSIFFHWQHCIPYLFVGITEEIVFRGWLLNATISEERKCLPIIVNTLLFLCIHLPIWLSEGRLVMAFTQLGFIPIAAVSLFFTWTMLRTKNLLVPIALHMLYDILLTILA